MNITVFVHVNKCTMKWHEHSWLADWIGNLHCAWFEAGSCHEYILWGSVILQVAINHKVFNDTGLSWLNSAGNNLHWQELSVVLLLDIEQSISILLGVSNTDSNFFEKTYPNNSFPAWTGGKRSRQWILSLWHSRKTLHSDLKSTFLVDSKQSVQCIELEICIWYPFVYESTKATWGYTYTLRN